FSLMPIQPRPMAETSSPVRANTTRFMAVRSLKELDVRSYVGTGSFTSSCDGATMSFERGFSLEFCLGASGADAVRTCLRLEIKSGKATGSRRIWSLLVASIALLLACFPAQSARATTTKSFVLSYFYPATYYGEDTCPKGLNPLPDVFFKRDLKILGLPQSEVDAMFDKDYNNQNEKPKTNWVSVVATRGNGKDNIYLHPTTVP